MVEFMVTTVDNPYNPFTQSDEWYAFDTSHGYNTASYLARLVRTSDELSDSDHNDAVNSAVEEIVRENVLGIYKLVTNSSES